MYKFKMKLRFYSFKRMTTFLDEKDHATPFHKLSNFLAKCPKTKIA